MIKHNFKILMLVLLLFCFKGMGQEYSTAGFYQTDASVREAINFNVGWRFIKQDIKAQRQSILTILHGAL